MPLYSGQNVNPAFDLHYSWTGWPRRGERLPTTPGASFFTDISREWARDHLTLESRKWTPEKVHLTFAATPEVAPVFFAARVKGRLQHALRQAGIAVNFSRKVSVRSLGHNVTQTVVDYVRDQLDHVDLADCRYREMLARQAVEDSGVDLKEPSETNSGRYWYNLHLVMVTTARYRVGGEEFLLRLRQAALDAWRRDGCVVKSLAVMPDHLHAALRGNVEMSPADIAVSFQNGAASAVGCRLWVDRFYAGTFGEYDLCAVGLSPTGVLSTSRSGDLKSPEAGTLPRRA